MSKPQLIQELYSGIFSFVMLLVQTQTAEGNLEEARAKVALYLRDLADQIENIPKEGNYDNKH